MLFVIFSLFIIYSRSYVPLACGGPDLCLINSIPACTVCCAEDSERLTACINGDSNFVDGENVLDFSWVDTIYVAGGITYSIDSINFGRETFLKGAENANMKILPYPGEIVTFSGEPTNTFDKDVFWTIGSEGATIVWDSSDSDYFTGVYTEGVNVHLNFYYNLFESPVRIGDPDAHLDVVFESCILEESVLLVGNGGDQETGGVSFIDCEFSGPIQVIGEHATFDRSEVFHNVDMHNALSFTASNSEFSSLGLLTAFTSEFYNCYFYNTLFGDDYDEIISIIFHNNILDDSAYMGVCRETSDRRQADHVCEAIFNRVNGEYFPKATRRVTSGAFFADPTNGIDVEMGNVETTPILDIYGALRENTRCPFHVGARTMHCGCESLQFGDICEQNKLLEGDFHDDNIPRGLGNSGRGDLFFTKSTRRVLEEVTIRSVCVNEYWGFLIDADFKLWTWGEDIDNLYIGYNQHADAETLVEVPIETEVYAADWNLNGNEFVKDQKKWAYDVNGEEYQAWPIKLICTDSSVYVLTHNGAVFAMGRGESYEIPSSRLWSEEPRFDILKSFHHVLDDVFDVTASEHSVYFTMNYVDGTTGMTEVQAIGMNHHGCLGAELDPHLRNQITEVTGEHSMYKFLNVNFEPFLTEFADPDSIHGRFQASDFIGLRPRVRPVSEGVFFTYDMGDFDPVHELFYVHLYAGKDHPALLITDQDDPDRFDTWYPYLIDFDNPLLTTTQIENSQKIDWVGRVIGGCLTIITDRTFYVSGNPECLNGPGIKGTDKSNLPYKMEAWMYGDYDTDDDLNRIYDFQCGYACYIVTRDNLYMFGRTMPPDSRRNIGFEAECEYNNCEVITWASSDIKHVIVGLGNSMVNSEASLDSKYDVLGFNAGSTFNYFEDNEVYKFPPRLEFEDSGMVSENEFRIHLTKPAVWMQTDTEIYFMKRNSMGDWEKRSNLVPGYSQECDFPKLGDGIKSAWDWKQVDDGVSPEDHFVLQFPWLLMREKCGWDYRNDFTDDFGNDFDVYSARVHLVENFYMGVEFAERIDRREEFFWDFEVRFPKQVLQTNILVQQDEFSMYWDAYITEKTFDRETRDGYLWFTVRTRKPNYFVFRDVLAPTDPDMSRLGDVLSLSGEQLPEFFEHTFDKLKLVELDIAGSTSDSDPTIDDATNDQFICDEKNCYQQYMLKFSIISDYRVCNVPTSTVPVYWKSFCLNDLSDDPECVIESRDVKFDIIIGIDNLCGGELIETIETEFFLTLYTDWSYNNEYEADHVFGIGDWLYFVAEVSAEEVTILDTKFDKIYLMDENGNILPLGHFYDDSQNPAISTDGELAGFVVTDLKSTTSLAFHFMIHNRIVTLQPSEKKTFMVEVHLAIEYLGNNGRYVTSRRQEDDGTSVAFNQMYSLKRMRIEIVNNLSDSFTPLPYIIAVCLIVCVALVIGSLVIAAAMTLCSNKKELLTKKGFEEKDDVLIEVDKVILKEQKKEEKMK